MSTRRREGPRRGGSATGPSQRQLRVGEELRHVLVEIMRDIHARDPELQDVNVTVTEVRISPDLSQATAYVMPFAGELVDETIGALNRAAGYFRTRIAKSVQLRHAPRISFALDTSFGYAEKIENLLRIPDVRRDLESNTDIEPDAESDTEA